MQLYLIHNLWIRYSCISAFVVLNQNAISELLILQNNYKNYFAISINIAQVYEVFHDVCNIQGNNVLLVYWTSLLIEHCLVNVWYRILSTCRKIGKNGFKLQNHLINCWFRSCRVELTFPERVVYELYE